MSDSIYFKETPVNPNNESKRLPVVFLLDVSPSMNDHSRITQLNLALNGFIEELKNDARTRKTVEIAIVTFSSKAQVMQDFLEVDKLVQQTISAQKDGATFLGTGIQLALDVLKKRREKYIKAGVSYFLPYLVIITDGKPEYENESILNDAISAVNTASKSTKADSIILPFPIGVGSAVTVEHLQRLAEGFLGQPIFYDDATEFSDLFQVISRSIKRSIHPLQNIEEQKKNIKNAWLEKLKDVRRKAGNK